MNFPTKARPSGLQIPKPLRLDRIAVGIKINAAWPQHTAVRLCLTGRVTSLDSAARAQPPRLFFLDNYRKARGFHHVRRQSRTYSPARYRSRFCTDLCLLSAFAQSLAETND